MLSQHMITVGSYKGIDRILTQFRHTYGFMESVPSWELCKDLEILNAVLHIILENFRIHSTILQVSGLLCISKCDVYWCFLYMLGVDWFYSTKIKIWIKCVVCYVVEVPVTGVSWFYNFLCSARKLEFHEMQRLI